MALWLAILLLVLVCVLGIFLGGRLSGGRACSVRRLPHGLYRIEAVIRHDTDGVWVVLWNYHEREERYVSIKWQDVLDRHLWEHGQKIREAADVLICKRGSLKYIRFQEKR